MSEKPRCNPDNPACADTENVLRAFRTSDYDKENHRYSSSLFRGADISLSRLQIKSVADLFEIFHAQLDRPPNEMVIGALEYNVGHLRKIGISKSVELSVIQDPLPENSAHACIPQKISRGVAKEILKSFEQCHEVSK